ncbi:MAG TPA: DUF882 domain-containing protein [Azospirillum sp.]|nr:DUF882 domain-containing protein [Azospirillum sp.]
MQSFVRMAALLVLVGSVLAGCATSVPVSDASRSIVLVHPASGESVSTTYWRSGSYDPRALFEISSLFRDRRTGQMAPVDPMLVDMLVELRQRLGLPESAPIHLSSGYRSPITNASLAKTNPNVAENSYHIRGQAADIRIPGVPPERLAEAAAAMRRGGYALYPHTGHVHVDTGPFRTWTPKGGEPRPNDGVLEARARPAPKVDVVEAKRPTGISEADAQRLRYMLVTLAAQDAPEGGDNRPTAVR